MKKMTHRPKLPHIIQDGLLILFAALMALVRFCTAWASCDRISWVRFVSGLPIQPAIKAILWGWW